MITLATLPDASQQEVFDQVTAHLLAQKQKSPDAFPRGKRPPQGAYRGPGGLKDAAGCLIGDDEYKPEWEGRLWRDLARSGEVPMDHHLLIHRLQFIHNNYDYGVWRFQLKTTAVLFNLDWSKLPFPKPKTKRNKWG